MNLHPSQPAAAQIAGQHPTQAKGARAHTRGTEPDELVKEVADSLWALFDGACDRACGRAAQIGAPWCIEEVLMPGRRRYRRTGARGEERSITVSLLLSVMAGRVRGGAFISTSRPYLSLFVAPVTRRGRLHWRVGTSGQLLTAGLVEDLFLGVLDDDVEAMRRLAPVVAYSLG